MAIDAAEGDEEQRGKRRENKERNRERIPNPATLNHSVVGEGMREQVPLQLLRLKERGKVSTHTRELG